LKSELSQLQSELDDIKKSAEKALEGSGSAQTSADESQWSREAISRITDSINEFMNQEVNESISELMSDSIHERINEPSEKTSNESLTEISNEFIREDD
jgi:hypothetical protein